MAWFSASNAASILPLLRRISPRARKARARLGSLATTASISANALSVWPLPSSATARVIMASRRSVSGVAGLSISAVQLSISFAGAATVSAAQITGGSEAGSALTALQDRTVMANTALAANGKTNDRITGSQKYGRACCGNAALEALSPQRSPRFEGRPLACSPSLPRPKRHHFKGGFDFEGAGGLFLIAIWAPSRSSSRASAL